MQTKRGFLKASGIIEMIIGILATIFGVLFTILGFFVFAMFDTIMDATEGILFEAAKILTDLMRSLGGLTNFIIILAGIIVLVYGIVSIVFGSKSIKYSKFDNEIFNKKKGVLITFIIFELIFSAPMFYMAFNAGFDLTSLISAIVYIILIPGFKILTLLTSGKKNKVKKIKDNVKLENNNVVTEPYIKTEEVNQNITSLENQNNVSQDNDINASLSAAPIVPSTESYVQPQNTPEKQVDFNQAQQQTTVDMADTIKDEFDEAFEEKDSGDFFDELSFNEEDETIEGDNVVESIDEKTIEEQVDEQVEAVNRDFPVQAAQEVEPIVEQPKQLEQVENDQDKPLDMVSELERLGALKEKGIINQIEFIQLKSELLSKLRKK